MPQNKQPKLVRISEKLQQNMQYVDELMGLETNFDIIHRVIRLGDTDACMYLIDGFCKDELMQKILQYLMDLKAEDFPKDAHEMSKIAIPYVEVDLDDTWEKILGALLSGVFVDRFQNLSRQRGGGAGQGQGTPGVQGRLRGDSGIQYSIDPPQDP